MTDKRFWTLGALILILNSAGLWAVLNVLQRGAVPGVAGGVGAHLRDGADGPAPGARPGEEGAGRLAYTVLPGAGDSAAADHTDRVTVLFNQPLAAAGARGQPAVGAPFRLSPAVAGRWVWAAADRLEFLLAERLPPGVRFTLAPGADFARLVEGSPPAGGRRVHHFATRALQVKSCRLLRQDDDHAEVELVFNQPLDPRALAEHTLVIDALTREKLDHEALGTRPADRQRLRVPVTTSRRVEVGIGRDLAAAPGRLGLGRDYRATVQLNGAFHARGSGHIDLGLEHEKLSVPLRFSRDLDRAQPAPKVVVNPPLPGRTTVSVSGSRLVLTGPFQPGRSYRAVLATDVLSADGQAVAAGEAFHFEVRDRSPEVRAPFARGVLSPGGNLEVELQVTNIEGLELRTSRVYPNNLVTYLQTENAGRTARAYPQRTIPLDLPRNEVRTFALDLAALARDAEADGEAEAGAGGEGAAGAGAADKGGAGTAAPLGVFHLEARASGRSWTRARMLVTVTDLALTAKHHRDGVTVWVTSLATGKPVPGAALSALSYTNQILARGVSGADGLATLSVPQNHPDGRPWVVVASLGQDLSYHRLDRGGWILDETALEGRAAPRGLDVFLYAERGVYRPGDTVHLTGVVRDERGRTPPPFPLEITVTRPDGTVENTFTAAPEAGREGLFHARYETWADGQTGRYQFRVSLPGAGETIGRLDVRVEAFEPVRLEVAARPGAERYFPGETPAVTVDARYLFGTPGAGLPVALQGVARRVTFDSAARPDFHFGGDGGDPDTAGEVRLPGRSASLDDSGQGTFDLGALAEITGTPGLWQADLYATVTEPGGRSVSAPTTFTADTAGRHLGVRFPAGERFLAGLPQKVEFAFRDGRDRPAEPAEIALTLERVERRWSLQEVNGRYLWRVQEEPVVVERRTLPAAGAAFTEDAEDGADPAGDFAVSAGAEVTCPSPGTYRLTVEDGGSGNRTRLALTATGGGGETLAAASPAALDLALERTRYRAGGSATVTVAAPFDGTFLLTLETDRVEFAQVLAVEGGKAVADVPLPEHLRGSALLTASLVRPVDTAAERWQAVRAHGVARLRVDHEPQRMGVQIEADGVVEPGASFAVRVSTATPHDPENPGVVHLWAVDTGILLAGGTGRPDPHGHFFAPRRPGVASGDLYNTLLPDQRRPDIVERIGAGSRRPASRRSPVKAEPKVPNVVWREVAPLREDGTYLAELTAPEMTGELKLMAVLVQGDNYGSAEAPVTVTAPLLVEPSWPRFAVPGDRFRVPVKLFNTTGETLHAKVYLDAEGPLLIGADGARSRHYSTAVEIPPAGTATAWVGAEASGLGNVTVTARAGAGKLAAKRRTTFPVRPATALGSDVRFLTLRAGETGRVEVPESILPAGASLDVAVAGSPLIGLRPAVQRLVGYPYGCVEQTTSRLIAMLHAPDLLPGSQGERARDLVEAGIARLRSMATGSGGLAYWPGGREPNLWGTTYAAAFLADAAAAGYRVDPEFTAGIARYLKAALYDDDTGLNSQAQICRVLAAFDQPDPARMALLGDRLDLLDAAGRAHLAVAWQTAGKRDRALRSLPDDTLDRAAPPRPSTSGRLTSRVRQEAALLDGLLTVEPLHPWVAELARRLDEERLRRGYWGTTLDNASAIAALSRYQAHLDRDPPDFKGRLRTAGGDGAGIAFDHTRPAQLSADGDGAVVIETEGEGSVYVTVTAEGLLREPSDETYDRRLRVRRRWLNAAGEELLATEAPRPDPVAAAGAPGAFNKVEVPSGPLRVAVGDLIQVEVTVASTDRRRVDNIAVVDALPAGFEVENPHLATSAPGAAGRRSRSRGAPSRVDFLDDRVVLFVSADRQERTYRYSLRAITGGDFTVPPLQASCMYDPAVASLHGAGRVAVIP